MPDSDIMPRTMEDPEERTLSMQLATVKLTFNSREEGDTESLSSDDLEQFEQHLLRPAFIRAQREIEIEFKDIVVLKNISVKNGSISVEAALFLVLAIGQAVGIGTLTTLTTNIVQEKLFRTSEKKKYEELLQKIELIIKCHTRDLSENHFHIGVMHITVYNPKLKEYKLEKFELISKDLSKLEKEVEIAVNNYHKLLRKI